MPIELPRLVVLDLYRNAIDTVEKISRRKADRKVHSWAVKTKKEVGDLMMQVASDEMYGEVDESEEDRQKVADEEFYGV